MQVITHPLGLLFVILLLVRPFGDYPVNDDWQYARAAKILAATHQLIIDTPVAPSLVGQLYVAAAVIRIIGFSHTLLRMMTLFLAVICWLSIDKILQLSGVSRYVRRCAGLLLVSNALFLHLSLSFMTEFWGYAPALLGAALWLFERRRAEATQAPAALRLGPAIAVALIIGSSFWVRQFCILSFPALLLATVGCLLGNRQWSRLRATLPTLSVAMLAFLAVTYAYFRWAQATGNQRSAFADPLARLVSIRASSWQLGWGIFWAYMALFLTPLAMVGFRGDVRPRARMVVCGVLWVSMAAAAWKLRTMDVLPTSMRGFLHGQFPYLSNVIHDAGVGPITLPDVFFGNLPRPSFPKHIWWAVEGALFVGAWFVAAALARTPGLIRASGLRGESVLFGLLFAASSLILTVQAYQESVFDRYLLAPFIGLLIVVAIAAEPEPTPDDAAPKNPPPRWRGRLAFPLALAPLLWFSVAGVHDYFRWNDARWALVRALLHRGVSPTIIQGGYEVNGWLNYDARRYGQPASGCVGLCRCAVWWPEWSCTDDSYQISMNPLPGYQPVAQTSLTYWLVPARGRLLASRRRW